MTYYSLPLTTEGCAANINQTFAGTLGLNFSSDASVDLIINEYPTSVVANLINYTTEATTTVQKITENVFGLYLISPIWYATISIFTVVIVGMTVSLATGKRDPELVNTSLISPLTWAVLRKLPVNCRKGLGFRSEKFLGKMRPEDIFEEFDKLLFGAQISAIKQEHNSTDKIDKPKGSADVSQVELPELKSKTHTF